MKAGPAGSSCGGEAEERRSDDEVALVKADAITQPHAPLKSQTETGNKTRGKCGDILKKRLLITDAPHRQRNGFLKTQ